MTPIVDPRDGDVEDDASSTKSRSLLSLAGAEAFVRLTDPLGISYYQESRRYMLDKVADEDLYNRHVPNLREVYQGVRVETNEIGLRDRPKRRSSPSGVR